MTPEPTWSITLPGFPIKVDICVSQNCHVVRRYKVEEHGIAFS